MADNNNKLTLLRRNKNIPLAIANNNKGGGRCWWDENKETRQQWTTTSEIMYVHKFSGMGTGKEKKTWSEDISRLFLKRIQYFPQKKKKWIQDKTWGCPSLHVAENRQGLWPSTWESQFWWIFKLHPYTSTIYQILAYKLRILNM